MAASDFTNIRLESNDPTVVTIRYSYGGSANITAWRSTDNSSFSQVVNIPSNYGSYPTMYDGAAAAATLYYYKLSDDAGSTFTSTFTVTTQSQFASTSDDAGQSLPVFNSNTDVNAKNLSALTNQVESVLNNDVMKPQQPCTVCPENGALVLDCSQGCYSFIVPSDSMADVNSISINCTQLQITFDVPEGTSTELCGWPPDFGFTGDECFQAPVTSPVTQNLQIIEPAVCQVTAIRVGAFPCAGEYTYDCYDKGSLSWPSNKFTFSMPSCAPSDPVSGCCSGNVSHFHNSAGSAILYSANNKKESSPTGGMSILFGRPGSLSANQPYEGSIDLLVARLSGNPIFGICMGVPTTATMLTFSGLVFMLNYQTNQVIVGQYNGGNLHAGDMPGTVYNSGSIPSGAYEIYLENFPSIADGIFDIYDSGGNTIFEYLDSGHTLPSANLVGFGFFWVGNTQVGVHAGQIAWNPGNIQIWSS